MRTSFDNRDTRPRVQQARPVAAPEAAQGAEQQAVLPELDFDDVEADTLPGVRLDHEGPNGVELGRVPLEGWLP